MKAPDRTAGPLDGVRVLDFSMFLAGPYAGRLLADHGAEVIKIEPAGGETMRGGHPVVAGRSRYFAQLNCGKKSIVLDLKSEKGIGAVRTLVAGADVVLENFRPGVMGRLGIGYDALRAIRPEIVYCAISGYGPTGANAGRPAFAPIVHAHSGHDMAVFDYARVLDRPPSNRGTAADILASTHAFGAISAALFRRERTGDGERIDVTLLTGIHNLLFYEIQAAQVKQDVPPLVYAPVRAADGFLMVTPISDANFRALAKAIGRDDWLSDKRFNTVGERWRHWDIMLAELESWTVQYSAEVAEGQILAAGCPCTRYRTVAEAINDPDLREQGGVVELKDGDETFLITNNPMRYRNATVGPRRWVADLGQHQEEVLGKG